MLSIYYIGKPKIVTVKVLLFVDTNFHGLRKKL